MPVTPDRAPPRLSHLLLSMDLKFKKQSQKLKEIQSQPESIIPKLSPPDLGIFRLGFLIALSSRAYFLNLHPSNEEDAIALP